MSIDELVSGAVEGLNLKALNISSLVRAAVLVLVGILLIRFIMKGVDRALARSKNMSAIQGYIHAMIKTVLWILLVLIVADSLSVPVNSLIALLSVAGLAISMALQNTLANLAGGIMLLVSRPFEIGDYVEADGVSGTVNVIGMSYSTLATPDNKEIFIPNSQIASAKIINYNRLGRRRIEIVLSASYDAPTEQVKAAVFAVLEQFPQILPDPAPVVWLSAYQPSSIDYVVRAWVPSGDYWDVYYGILEGVRPAFARYGVEMTYNHLNVHLLEEPSGAAQK